MASRTSLFPAVPDTNPPWNEVEPMYAIAFDLDAELLEKRCPSPSGNNAYRGIRDALYERGLN